MKQEESWTESLMLLAVNDQIWAVKFGLFLKGLHKQPTSLLTIDGLRLTLHPPLNIKFVYNIVTFE